MRLAYIYTEKGDALFIAHLPAGYLLADRMTKDQPHRAALIATGLVASIFPDFDLLWFYLIDGRQSPHHDYVFHWPLFWIAVAFVAWLTTVLCRKPKARPFIAVALACLLLHMALDSIAAEIAWFKPLSGFEVNLTEVPPRYDWWVWNFILHWTFALEIMITAAAGFKLWQNLQLR